MIARVAGRPITQRSYDQIAEPYFARLKAQMGDAFQGDILKMAQHNVLDELVRRQILSIEAEKANLAVTEADIDSILATDPFFSTDGGFDPRKLQEYKLSPSSNYRVIYPKVADVAKMEKFDRQLRARLTPSNATVRAEWNKRNEQVRFQYLPITLREVSLDPEATADEQLAYYKAHPDLFEKKANMSLRYVRLPLPEADSLREAETKRLEARGKAMADSLKRGVPIDSIRAVGGVNETGAFDLPATAIPGLGNTDVMADLVKRADADTNLKVLGPATLADAVIVAVVSRHESKHVPAFAEVRGDVKRRADSDKRRNQLDQDKHAWYDQHKTELKTAHARVLRVSISEASLPVKASTPAEVERWYAQHARELFAGDSVRSKKPPALDDSLRDVVGTRLSEENRAARLSAAVGRVATGWKQGRNVVQLAHAEGSRADTLSFLKDTGRDSLFTPQFIDSLLGETGRAQKGVVQGPRRFGQWYATWRIEASDTAYTPSYDEARSRVDRGFQEERQRKDDVEGKAYFELHRTDYKTAQKYSVDYVQVKIPPPDSVTIPEAELKRYYQQHTKDKFRQEEQVRARHILISTKPDGSDADRMKARADSLRQAIVAGADFGDLARKFSQDPGSGAQGGDLGFFARGRMVKEFQDTSFALPVGRVSQPVRTRFGWHLIKVDEKRPEGIKPYDEARPEIRTELGRTRGDTLALRKAKRILAQLGTKDATTAAATAGGIKSAQNFAANDPVPGVGPVQDLSADIGTLTVGRWARKPYRSSDSWVLVRPTKRVAPTQAEFDEVKRQAVDDMKNSKKRELITKKTDATRTQLTAGASLDSIAGPLGGLKETGLVTRQNGFVPMLGAEPRVLDQAFAMKVNTVSDTIQVSQGVVWIRPEERKTLEGASFTKDGPQITQELLTKNMEDWTEKAKKSVHIEVLRADLREPAPPKIRTVTTSLGGRQ